MTQLTSRRRALPNSLLGTIQADDTQRPDLASPTPVRLESGRYVERATAASRGVDGILGVHGSPGWCRCPIGRVCTSNPRIPLEFECTFLFHDHASRAVDPSDAAIPRPARPIRPSAPFESGLPSQGMVTLSTQSGSSASVTVNVAV